MSKRAGEKQVRRTFRGKTAKARGVDRVPKTDKAIGSVQHAMGDLPVEIDHRAVKIEEEQLGPGRRPIE